MQICRMNYNDLSDNGRKAKFHCYGVGIFDVFSGQDPYVNKSECSYIEKSAIPPGQYWIVDRPVGSIANQVRGTALDMIHGTNHSQWFGLYPIDFKMHRDGKGANPREHRELCDRGE
ncbi:DUF2778 domain-containing protein [Photorhabdus sp. APURE]|nr:DUF2778 domain-containing protein [Photorhabdus aballayi]